MAAVVMTRPPAWRRAAVAPHSSARRSITPPWTVPKALACPGWVMMARLTREAEAGLAAYWGTSGSLPGLPAEQWRRTNGSSGARADDRGGRFRPHRPAAVRPGLPPRGGRGVRSAPARHPEVLPAPGPPVTPPPPGPGLLGRRR